MGSHFAGGSQLLAACSDAASGKEVGRNLSQPSAAEPEGAAGMGSAQGDGHGADNYRVVLGDFSTGERRIGEQSRSKLEATQSNAKVK